MPRALLLSNVNCEPATVRHIHYPFTTTNRTSYGLNIVLEVSTVYTLS